MSPLLLVAPFVKRMGYKIAEELTEKGAKKLIDKIQEKTGVKVSDSKTQEVALSIVSSKDLKDIEKYYTNTLNTEIKHGEDLSNTWKDEYITVSVIGLLYSIILLSVFNIDLAKEVINSLKSILELKYFGLSYLSVVLSGVGLRTALLKLIDKKFK